MPATTTSRGPVLQWVVVLVLGVLVVTVVLGLNLISRLDAGQKVLEGARPAFSVASLNDDQAGINVISQDVDMVAPIVTHAPGANAAGAKLAGRFPRAGALLQAVPLSLVSAELPGLEAFLARALKLTPAGLQTQLRLHSPGLAQTFAALPAVTSGWKDVPGLAADRFTGFDGAPLRTVPGVRDYLVRLVAALAAQKGNFDGVGSSSLTWIAPVVLAIGIVVVVLALVMLAVSLGGVSRRVAVASAAVVVLAGAAVVVLVLATSLIPRLQAGQRLVTGLDPAFTAARVKGARDAVAVVGTIVRAEDPIMTPAGGAAREASGVVAYAAKVTHTSRRALLATLASRFPHDAALLGAIPLSAVAAEARGVGAQLPHRVAKHLRATFANLPAVTGAWGTVPVAVAHFSNQVIPVLERERGNWAELTSTSELGFVGWLVLALGVVALVYGLLMVSIARSR